MKASINEHLEKIAIFTRDHLYQSANAQPDEYHDPKYRWEHTLRVCNYGKIIAEEEGADVGVVVAACLLHDIAHFEPGVYKDHGRVGANMSKPLLEQLDFSAEQLDNICYSIAVHVDGEAGYEHEETLEAKCVSDADNIDRFSALRILMYCAPELNDLTALADKLGERLKTLEKYRRDQVLETNTGNRLFNHQLDRQIEFFKTIVHEKGISKLPVLSDV